MKRPKAGRQALPDRWFPGFSSPNFTSVPDEVFDLLLSVLTEAELKVLLYIIRRTFGFKKTADSISIRQMTRGIRTAAGQQLDSGTGLSVPSVTKAVKSLERQGIIVAIRSSSKQRGSETTTYALNLRPAARPQLKLLRPPSKNSLDPPLNSLDPQESGVQDAEEQQLQALTDPVVAPPSHRKEKPEQAQPSPAEDQAYRELLDLGVHQRTARSLSKSHPAARILELAAYLRNKLASGWLPRESPAAWIVAALRDGYAPPQQAASSGSPGEKTSEPTVVFEGADLRAQLWEERQARLQRLGITEEVDELWRGVLLDLRQAGQWSPALSACLLRRRARSRFEIVVPWHSLRKRVEQHLGAVERCLRARTGQRCQVGVVEESA